MTEPPPAATPTDPEGSGPSKPPRAKAPFVRIVLVIALIGSLIWLGRSSGLGETLSAEHLRQTILDTGGWGIAIFVGAFILAQLLYIPGMVFVGVAVWCWGPWVGGITGYLTGIVSVSINFGVIRLIGGRPLAGIEKPWVRKMLDRLHDHPIITMAALRTFMFMSPPLNTALALSGVRHREYAAASVVGLVLPVGVATWLFHLAFS